MPYPGYPPYMPDYPSPTTPQRFAWEVEPADQVRGIVPQPQEPQTISPIVFQQHQQLSPVDAATPQEQPQPPLQQQVPFDPPRMIELQERVMPSLFRFDNIDESHFTGARKRASTKAPSRVGADEMHSGTSPSSSGAGPSRVPHPRAHTQNHPYRRPQSAASPVGAASGTQAGPVRSISSTVSRRTPARVGDDVLNERASHLRPGYGGTPAVTLAVGSSMAVSCPAMPVWRVNTFERPAEQGQRVVSGGGSSVATNRYADASLLSAAQGESSCRPTSSSSSFPSPAATSPTQTPAVRTTELSINTPQAQTQALPDTEKRFSIRTDVHFDTASNQMTAMLELPGLKKDEIRIVMNVCPFSGVRQLTISGRSRPSLPSGLYTMRERKFGVFGRAIPVPMSTKAEDVIAIMEDGILILKIPCGTPAPREEPKEITIH